MKIDRRAISIGVTVFVAGAAGHLVQNADRYFAKDAPPQLAATQSTFAIGASTPRFVGKVTPLAATADTSTAGATSAHRIRVPDAPEVARAALTFETDARSLAARIDGLEQGGNAGNIDARELNWYGLPCETGLEATARPAAMVDLSLTATCHDDERVTVLHGGLHFATRTDDTGALRIEVPALAADAAFVLEFDDGTVLSTRLLVPEVVEYDRVVLQWQGENAMHIHAYEFGADYGDAGHVWFGNPRDAGTAAEGRSGFLTALGDAALPQAWMAEVYSFPRGESRQTGVVRVSVEAEVNEQNCSRQIAAETLQPGVGGEMQPADLSLAVPGCEAVGEYLVLKNILRDLKIARN